MKQLAERSAIAFSVFAFALWPAWTFSIFVFLFVPLLWPIPLLYVAWWWYDRETPRRGARLVKYFRDNLYTTYMARYFNSELIKTADLPPDRNYIIGSHPHGIFCFGTQVNLASDATGFDKLFPGINPHVVTLPIQFCFPFKRDYCLLQGLISSDAEAIRYVLTSKKQGNAVIIVPGGAEEALDSHPDNWDLTLNHRKGFIKMAITTGAMLVPCYHFGENNTYHQLENKRGTLIRKIQTVIKNTISFSPCVFSGVGLFNDYFGMLPIPTKLTTVVGAPIDVGFNTNPTREEVAAAHKKYVDALVDLFDAHKVKCGIAKDVKLNIL